MKGRQLDLSKEHDILKDVSIRIPSDLRKKIKGFLMLLETIF
jgi:hypothetical protein